ncbi:uncharacterized protein TRIADDRAFT_24469 [Trichoplax adhaerens]|uniref:Flavin-containing monooxygenase n=1 Tax=Trichoplax adhaerens TaxID=10228 RepID=B3RTM0_TRIAD|nr:hypothetical protein TRIADDRAFT_24469 [Trichoplax adhaerens]EDV25656.1 hypothetical protein TRIADDRAFT_24469 [Trichoplax adhaerens]|eukprot:XP_002111689.1 hypothetical protein TRIADDRAFT_24469 [Trichoplax adhaerens]
MKKIRVAVIGAGAAGLAALRQLSKYDVFQPVAYEIERQVGGTWIYKDLADDFDPTNINLLAGQSTTSSPPPPHCHSSMYQGLYTNIPKEIMAFPDLPFPQQLPSYPHHTDVLAYLRNYAHQFKLLQYIQFGTMVNSLSRQQIEDKSSWTLTYTDLDSKETTTTQFDAVIVCNGHYCKTSYPDIPDLDQFPGAVTHSHYYREPSIYKDKVVVLMGPGPSGTDIAIELIDTAKEIYLSCHKQPAANLPSKIVVKNTITKLHSNGFVQFEKDPQLVKADCVIFCTGYGYEFPFLTPSCNVTLENQQRRIRPLFMHIFHIDHPTLSFVGICAKIVPFGQFYLQASVVTSVLLNQTPLPSIDEMERDEENDYQDRLATGLQPRHAHFLGVRQWAYNDRLATFINVKNPMSKAIEKTYKYAMGWRQNNILEYRHQNYRIIDEDTFEHVNACKNSNQTSTN